MILIVPWIFSKEIKPVNSKGNEPWIHTGRTDAETEAPILWTLDVKSWITGKDPDGGKDWGQEEKGMTEDEMVGWHHWPNGHELEQTPGDGEEQGPLSAAAPGVTKSQTQLSDWPTTHASKAMLKVLHARLLHYGSQELPDVQAGLEKEEELEIKLLTFTGL